MSREAAVDLEGASLAAGLLRPPPAASPIAQERVAPGRPSAWFVLTILALAVGALAVSLFLGARGAAVPAEEEAAELVGWDVIGLSGGRIVAAGAHAATVAGVAMAARRLAHSETAGLLAAVLVAADPTGLLLGSLAVPQAVAVAGMAWALACVTSPIPLLHWASGLALAVATLALPAAAVWIIPLALLLLLRGHIYAAPQHFALSIGQVAILPAIALGVRAALDRGLHGVPACLSVGLVDSISLQRLASPGPDLLVLPNPVVWLAGAAAIAFLGLGGLAFAAARFRVARAPGRLQIRLVSSFPAVLGRGLWLLVLVLLAPPALWLPLFAIALALGVRELGEDAPGFGIALALALVAFAGLVLWRAWGAVAGEPGAVADALNLVPWAQAATCP